MKQKPITLRKFVETFPLESFQEKILTQLPPNFNELSYKDKYRFNALSDKVFKLSVSKNAIYATINFVTVHRVGHKIYKKSEKPTSSIYIKPNKITIKGGREIIPLFLNYLGINWFINLPPFVVSTYFAKSSIFRAILTKRIYNEETLYKRIGTSCFQLKNVSWRAIKNYCINENFKGISIFDLRDFTKNVEQSIEVICNCNRSEVYLYEDLLYYAVELEQIVNFKWSKNRIHQEHQKQILSKQEGEISNKDVTPIYNLVIGDDNIRLLNTERDIFLEGALMSHCLYRCYYSRIKNKNYVAFHMKFPEDCTFSAKLGTDGDIIFDQIYLKYDRPVKDDTRLIAQEFIKNNCDSIKKMFGERKKSELLNWNPFRFDDDIF